MFFSKNISTKAARQSGNQKGTFYDYYIILKNIQNGEHTTYHLDYTFNNNKLIVKVKSIRTNGLLYIENKILEIGEAVYFDDMKQAQKYVKDIVNKMLENGFIKIS